jgi:hypothetical protein
MMLPSAETRPVIVFKVWPSLDYNKRLIVSFTLIAVGLMIQIWTLLPWGGLVLIVAGNLLLLVSGYDNRIDFKKFEPHAKWERTGVEKLEELLQFDKKIQRWDRSVVDVTNPLGLACFVLLTSSLGIVAILYSGLPRILVIDAAVLFLPHWVTGIRRVIRQPKLLIKVETIHNVLEAVGERLYSHRVDIMLLLWGADAKLPQDIKFKVDIQGHHPDFLGLYGQVVLNEVQGSSYPYFYVVLVARRGFGLDRTQQGYAEPRGMVTELKNQGEVEVFVIRQKTTRKSGYHTKKRKAVQIFLEGLTLAERVAEKP